MNPASTDPVAWTDLALANRDALPAAREGYQAVVDERCQSLETRDLPGVASRFAREVRDR